MNVCANRHIFVRKYLWRLISGTDGEMHVSSLCCGDGKSLIAFKFFYANMQ